jgi:hypothetical protein
MAKKSETPTDLAAWLEQLVDRGSHAIAYGRFRSKKLRAVVDKELARRGPNVMPDLLDIVLSADRTEVRAAAAEALATLDSAPLLAGALETRLARDISALSRAEKTSEMLTRRWLVHALGDLGARAHAALPLLEQAASSGDPILSKVAQYAIDQVRR